MPAISTVLYPRDAKFDLDYYLSTHMPLVQEKWSPFGLQKWTIVQYDDEKSPYKIQATLEWSDFASWEKARDDDVSKVVLGDIKNFSDKDPTIMSGKVVGTA